VAAEDEGRYVFHADVQFVRNERPEASGIEDASIPIPGCAEPAEL